MFSGKTDELIRRLVRATIAKQKVQVFKPAIDIRYAVEKVASHTGSTFDAIPVEKSAEIRLKLDSDTTVVGIDEAQFFDDEVVAVAKELAARGVRVIVAGLDTDFRGEPFGSMPVLMAEAENVAKLHAICMVCGDDASRTQRLVNDRPARYDDPVVIVGASEMYEARCRQHHEVPRWNMQNYNEFLSEILIDSDSLQARIKELGAQISLDYPDGDLMLICILRGGVPFMVDLSRSITVPHMMDFMAVSSYGVGKRESTGSARVTLDLQTDIRSMNVLLVEDIVDSGHTISAVLQMLETRQPKSLKVCALLDKPERREADVPIDYLGFSIPNKFVFGYGLDIDEYHRNLSFIGVVDLDKYKPAH